MVVGVACMPRVSAGVQRAAASCLVPRAQGCGGRCVRPPATLFPCRPLRTRPHTRHAPTRAHAHSPPCRTLTRRAARSPPTAPASACPSARRPAQHSLRGRAHRAACTQGGARVRGGCVPRRAGCSRAGRHVGAQARLPSRARGRVRKPWAPHRAARWPCTRCPGPPPPAPWWARTLPSTLQACARTRALRAYLRALPAARCSWHARTHARAHALARARA